MRKIPFVLAAFVIACGSGSTTVSTSSTPPTGGGTDGGMGTPTPGGGGGGMPGGGGGGTGGTGGGGGGGGTGGSGGGGAGGGGGTGGGTGCTDTTPRTIVANLKSASHVRVDDQWVYYLDQGPTSLWRARKDGSDTPTRIEFLGTLNDDVYSWDFAVDATTIYVMHYGKADMTLTAGSVDFLDKSLALVRHVDAQPAPNDCHTPLLKSIAVAGGDLYWVQMNGYRDTQCPQIPDDIMRVPAGTSVVEAITAGADSGGIRAILADDFHVFWGDANGISRIGRLGGPRELLAPGWGGVFASDGNNLFTNGTDNDIERISAPGVYASIRHGVFSDLADDGTHLYVATGPVQGAALLRMNGDGSDSTTLTSDAAASVAVDDRYAYYTLPGEIRRVCK